LIHIHNAPQFVDGLAGKIPGARVMLHMHNEKDYPLAGRLDALVACSDYINRWFREKGVAAGVFATLPNGVDTVLFSAGRTPQLASESRARRGIPAGRFVVLFVGRISPEKGPDLLVRAARHLDRSAFHFVFVGEWPKGDPEKSERVRFADVLRHDLQGIPCTLVDTVNPADMHLIYSLGDLVVIPSRFEEPFSMVAIEAMSSGVPVMALRKGGMTEYMVDGQNATLIDADASDVQLAGAIQAAAGNSVELHRMARAARAMVEARFTWNSVAAQTEALYDRIRERAAGA